MVCNASKNPLAGAAPRSALNAFSAMGKGARARGKMTLIFCVTLL